MLVSNELGDHQMETYFESTPNDGGMICNDGTGKHFQKVKEVHEQWFEDLGGGFLKREGEKICAIRLASAVFFKVLLR